MSDKKLKTAPKSIWLAAIIIPVIVMVSAFLKSETKTEKSEKFTRPQIGTVWKLIPKCTSGELPEMEFNIIPNKAFAGRFSLAFEGYYKYNNSHFYFWEWKMRKRNTFFMSWEKNGIGTGKIVLTFVSNKKAVGKATFRKNGRWITTPVTFKKLLL